MSARVHRLPHLAKRRQALAVLKRAALRLARTEIGLLYHVRVMATDAASEPLASLLPSGTFVEIANAGLAFTEVYVLPNTVLQEQGSVWVVRDGDLHLSRRKPMVGQVDRGVEV